MFDETRLFTIQPAQVDRMEPLIFPMLKAFEQETAVVSAEEVLRQAKEQLCQLWGYHDGESLRCVVATRVNEGIGRKGCLVWVCFGRDFLELANGVLERIEKWAKSIDCTHVEIIGRDGWGRIISGYRKTAVVFEKSLLEMH